MKRRTKVGIVLLTIVCGVPALLGLLVSIPQTHAAEVLSEMPLSAYSLIPSYVALIIALLPSILNYLDMPILGITFQEPHDRLYWHSINANHPTENHSIVYRQLRIWLENEGNREADNCGVRLRVSETKQLGKIPPVDYALPAFRLYTPYPQYDQNVKGYGLRAPRVDETSLTVPANSSEAYDLLYCARMDDQKWHCYVYSKSPHELRPTIEYSLELTITSGTPSIKKGVSLPFRWNGNVDHLENAIDIKHLPSYGTE
jgi:hypothetical protein